MKAVVLTILILIGLPLHSFAGFTCEDLFRFRLGNVWPSTKAKFGEYDISIGRTGPSVSIDLYPGPLLTTNRLAIWGRATESPAFQEWPMSEVLPVRSAYAVFAELSRTRQGSLLNPFVFRRLFVPFVVKHVDRGRRIHANLDSRDEAFIRALAALPERERKTRVENWLREFWRSQEQLEGAMTRFELLSICGNPKLFTGTIFYRDYGSPLSAGEVSGLRLF